MPSHVALWSHVSFELPVCFLKQPNIPVACGSVGWICSYSVACSLWWYKSSVVRVGRCWWVCYSMRTALFGDAVLEYLAPVRWHLTTLPIGSASPFTCGFCGAVITLSIFQASINSVKRELLNRGPPWDFNEYDCTGCQSTKGYNLQYWL